MSNNYSTDNLNKNYEPAREVKSKSLTGFLEKNLSDRVEDFVETSRARIAMGRDYVKQNPATGVAIAATAGMLAGYLATLFVNYRKK